MALSADDPGTLWSRVLREPSGTSFNSLVQLEVEHGIPRNPFINSGALVVTDHLMERFPDAAGHVLQFLGGQVGQHSGQGPFIDEVAAKSELANSSRNLALAHFLKDFGNLHAARRGRGGELRQAVLHHDELRPGGEGRTVPCPRRARN